MKIPFADFRPQYDEIRSVIDVGLKNVFEKANFILGDEVREFERLFAEYSEARYGVGVNSGTDALHFAVRALGIGPGDEVILPTFTFIATALAVSYTGARPVFVDIEEDIYAMDPQKIEAVITPRTKAIIPVHLYGQMANIEEILAIAQKHSLRVIEDTAQAHGALYKGKRAGSFGDIGCFSFYPTKGLGAFGDGGMAITSNETLYKKILMLRDYGREQRYEHIQIGYNSRLDTVQAVVLAAKLEHLDRWNTMRNKIAKIYIELLKSIDGVIPPVIRPDRTHTFQTFAVRIRNRDEVCAQLQKRGIGVLIHYPIPIHLQKAYEPLGYRPGDFPVSEKVANEILSLPMFPHMKKEQVEIVCRTIQEVLKHG